ncbi:YheU family protein [Pseudomonas neustonica]|uniref:YheU family protein n=1 Tax=Pseudomonas neustonica TaxID=2487346 RepID=A0ABX9XHC6_9PSED|nr:MULTISPECIES: YheU family protein [Pseudomonas]MBA6418909.1 YheU family protein [Pseudomonas sp. 5Ae-yellow]ROZ82436.1 YheU family protein [Pseudomonas sp. SSM44]ROZ84316.1 YheU family protein [Pseudomonas neustonica]|tara:strand:+ start:522 stop:770 length:249 start_codon:yes stop_codon:yes gene_type:complete
MLIPYQMLETETLQRLLEDFVTRDGTDNGFEDSLEQRVAQVRKQLERKELLIVFHPDTGDASLSHKRDVPPDMLRDFLAAQD